MAEGNDGMKVWDVLAALWLLMVIFGIGFWVLWQVVGRIVAPEGHMARLYMLFVIGGLITAAALTRMLNGGTNG